MDQQTVRKTYKTYKTYKYQLTPTPQQALAVVVRRCCDLSTAALQERKEAGQKCGVSVTEAMQRAHLPAVKDARPEYRDIHSQVLQDMLTRRDRAFHAYFRAFFRRVKKGETPGYPRFAGVHRHNRFTDNSCTDQHCGNGATLDKGFLVLSKIGRIAVRPCAGAARWRARPRPSRSAGKRVGGRCPSPALLCQYTPCPLPARRSASIWDWRRAPPLLLGRASLLLAGSARPSGR